MAGKTPQTACASAEYLAEQLYMTLHAMAAEGFYIGAITFIAQDEEGDGCIGTLLVREPEPALEDMVARGVELEALNWLTEHCYGTDE